MIAAISATKASVRTTIRTNSGHINQLSASLSSLSLSSRPASTSTSTRKFLPSRSFHSSTATLDQNQNQNQPPTTADSEASPSPAPTTAPTPAPAVSATAPLWQSIQESLLSPAPRSNSSSRLSSPPSSRENFFQSYVQAAESNFKRRITLGSTSPSDPTSGRQVPVQRHQVERAYRLLNATLRRNNLRRELKLGDRYEKPNEERRRKRSERHRRRFKDLVRTKVQLVMALKARGA